MKRRLNGPSLAFLFLMVFAAGVIAGGLACDFGHRPAVEMQLPTLEVE